MGTLIDLTGNRFGQIEVLYRAPNRLDKTMWYCRCVCGKEFTIHATSLRKRGQTACYKCAHTKHGLVGTPIYRCYYNMIRRCHDPRVPGYMEYGARGISVCDRWRNSVTDFASDMGDKPAGYSIERIDNGGNYTPENCTWASRHSQLRNTRRNRNYTHKGVTKCLQDWCAEYGILYATMWCRLKHMPFSEAIETPVNHRPAKLLFTYRGKTQSLTEWCREYGVKRRTIAGRIERGWPFEIAITAPIGHRHKSP